MNLVAICACASCTGTAPAYDDAKIQRWEEQLSLARHLEAWRKARGLSFADAADVFDLLLMLDDERLERAMQGVDVYSDGE